MSNGPQEWQRLAWAMYAHDLAVDEPTEADYPDCVFMVSDWHSEAEAEMGMRARQFIAATDALARIRAAAIGGVPWPALNDARDGLNALAGDR